LRALHVFPHFSVDLSNGASHYQYAITKALRDRGVDVEVFTTRTERFVAHAAFGLEWPDQLPAGATQIGGIPVRRLGGGWSPSPRVGRFLSRQILRRWEREGAGNEPPEIEARVGILRERARSRPTLLDAASSLGRGPVSAGLLSAIARGRARWDVVLVGYAPFALLGSVTRLCRLLRLPVVVLPLFHAADPYHHFRAIYGSFERADRVLVQTPYAVDLFRTLFPRSRPVEIGVGIDPPRFHADPARAARFRARHGLESRRIVLLVGRKEPGKRWSLAVEAVERLDRDDVTLVMIGRDVDRQPIASAKVLHLEEVDEADLLDAYSASDLLVFPSELESFGFVLLEAWMFGKPVVGSRLCGPVASVIREGVDGFLAGDAVELADRIDHLLGDPLCSRRLGEAGRERVLTRYTWDELARRVERVYEEASLRDGRS
jgi:glycosyltransferase involved in cell wall biosynthesis